MIDSFELAGDQLLERAGWSLVWLAIVATGVDAWGQWSAWPGMVVVSLLMVLTGILGAVVLWSVSDPTSERLRHSSFVAASMTLLFSQGVAIATRHFYTTDSAAFNQLSARQLLDGRNPYAASMTGAGQLLHPASSYWSYLVNGAHVISISYPAGSFVFQIPLVALGIRHLSTDWLDLFAWLATGVVLYVILPSRLRWIAPLLLLSGVFAGPFANGSTDALYIPFLVLAVWRWDRFAKSHQPALTRWLSPVALGVACSIKQSPWFCVPFLLVGTALEARAAKVSVARTTTRYALMTIATFLVINVAFIVWGPRQWWRAVLLPFRAHLVADGQGLVSLAIHGLSGGVDLSLLSLSALLMLVAQLVAMVLWYPALKRSWLFFLPLTLAIPGRSLSDYLVDLVPVAFVAALSVQAVARPRVTTRHARSRLIIAVPLVASALVAALAFRSAPLSVHVDNVTTADSHQRLTSITLTVRNQSGPSLTPRFMMTINGGHPSGFWRSSLDQGTLPLKPGASATITIRPEAWTWAPHRADYWLVEAFTATPYALSTSVPQRWPFGPLQ